LKDVSTLRLVVAIGLTAGISLERTLALSPYTVWGLSLPVFFWCGGPFHLGLLRSLRNQRANTDMLVSLSMWASFLYSTIAVFEPLHLLPRCRSHLLVIMGCLVVAAAGGRWLETFLTERSGEALGKIRRRIPRTARRLSAKQGGRPFENVSIEALRAGDRVLVLPGEQISTDGTVVEGSSHVDESLWTDSGEMVEKTVGSRVLSGTQNKDGELTITVDRPGTRSAIARLAESIGAGFELKSVRAGIADGLASGYVPAVVIVAVAAALLWSWKGPEPRLTHALTALMMILVVACPWAVTIASPAALALGLRRAGRMNIRIRNPNVLEKLDRVDTLIVDKKGILTEGRLEVRDVICFGDWGRDQLLRTASIAEHRSGHPFASALLRRLKENNLPDVDSRETYPGQGISVRYAGDRILAGSPAWLAEQGVPLSKKSRRLLQGTTDTLLAVAVGGELAGAVTFSDAIRSGVPAAVETLAAMGIEVVLASGDRNQTAHRVAEQVGIQRVYSEVLESDKARIVEDLQSQGKKVVIVGDGMRDAAALSRADLGISVESALAETLRNRRPVLGAGIDLAAESADVILLQRDLDHLLSALKLCLKIREVIRGNLKWAFGMHILLIPVAAGALYAPLGAKLSPAVLGGTAAASILAILIHSIQRYKDKDHEKAKPPTR